MIIPAIIPETIDDVVRHVELVVDYVSRVQVDVSDGYFAPNRTWPFINTNGYTDMVAGKERMPFAESIDYEIHLMVQDPLEKMVEWIAAGASSVIAHASMLEAPHKMRQLADEAGIEFGIAVTPTEYQIIDDSLFDLADFVQVMGSDSIGRHGVKLSDESVSIIKSIAKNYQKPIAIDIGVNKETIPRLREAGATRFVSGSAIFSPQKGH